MPSQLFPASLGEDVGALLEQGERRRWWTPWATVEVPSSPGLAFTLTVQCGQTKPLIFSTTPNTRSPIFLQKVSSRCTSPTDTAWMDQLEAQLGCRVAAAVARVPGCPVPGVW